jgi:DNA-binding MarR family transcriptional regulator
MAKGSGKTATEAGRSEDLQITLGVLSAIEADSAISQRTLSNELGVALGLANAYLKRCVRKGYVKITAVPRRRYTYYLTPQGFAEKARLTGEYLTSSLQFFRRARQQIDKLMEDCAARGLRRVALAGASDLAEIATLTAHDHDVTLVGVVDDRLDKERFCGLPVAKRLSELGSVDAVIVTVQSSPAMDKLVQDLTAELGAQRVLVPDLIKTAHIRKGQGRARRGAGGADRTAAPAE